MNAGFRIRPAVEEDITGAVRLERTIENVPHWAVADYVAAVVEADHAADLQGIERCFFVAEAGRQVVGFAVGRLTMLEAEVLAELETVAVADAFRRAGIGRALCEAVIRWARENRAAEIELEVRSRSAGAISLYKALGFSAVGARRNYYRDPADDAVLMRLALRTSD
jgi:ribosomal-protein-alanine N-acetyltransferase